MQDLPGESVSQETPKYPWGMRVRAMVDLHNDGTYPDKEPDALLVPAAAAGEIVQIGTHTETGITVYLVEFGESTVVGCLEGEIAPWPVGEEPVFPSSGEGSGR